MNRFVLHDFDHSFKTFRSADDYFMGKTHFQCTKLDDKLLETFEIQIVDLPFVEYFDIDISDQRIDFRLRS